MTDPVRAMHTSAPRGRATPGASDPAGERPRRRATGTAAQIYLGLWNRGTEITSAGRTDVLDRWHRVQRVRWS